MAFTAVPFEEIPNRIGDRKVVVGKYTSESASTGGIINTHLRVCENLMLQQTGTAAGTVFPVVSSATAFPIEGGAIKIITQANEVGFYKAYGR